MAELTANDYVYPARVDWVQVLEDLHLAGITGYRVAALLGMEWSTVQGWLRGQEPRHSTGQALLELHRRYCSPQATQKRQREAKVAM